MDTDKKWFESWFDSSYYHLLYEHRDEKEAGNFIDNLFDKIQPELNSKILDLACGRGRHTEYMAKLGYQLTGIDLSESNIEYCKNLSIANAEFYVHDMRKIFRTNYFDCIVNLFTSFGYFNTIHENGLVLQSANQSLRKDGVFILDYLNISRALTTIPYSEEIIKDNFTFRIKKVKEGQFIRKYIDVNHDKQDHHFFEQIVLFDKKELIKIMESNQFKITDIYGDYNLQAFDQERSERLILIGRKA